MVYRKLHENVKSFHDYIAEKAEFYARVMEVSLEEAKETLKAKMVGRWSNGVPLMKAPTSVFWRSSELVWFSRSLTPRWMWPWR